ncbi:uncharacterized protein LOC127810201 isoform X2 [Diospyros lotus]|uniref:uncharacterized protein LOC127810201 isoform X1 n=1 Tax=Diospyros lotus TaxID=55363 RepID=UPI00225922EE|nr:uncharacterized protein LOC127810201 isoform X1 [Diospyros lotus]XP_052205508.1 uncharacterized protein LOC127810201 isoform X2 [Diospyros lotus]
MLRQALLVLALLGSTLVGPANSHQETGEWHCDSESEIRVEASFRPGIVTLDGHVDDWTDIYGFDFSLLPALDPDADKEYEGGKLTVKALHDGKDVFFMVQVDGHYAYSKGENNKCPSVALMFQTGENATYHRMGGCVQGPDTCTSKTCHGHEVDIMHFSIGNAIPGRLYGGNSIDNSIGNGGDRFGHLVDTYAWNPHCHFLDGLGPSGNDTSAQNNWKGVWWHSSLTSDSGFVEEDSPYTSDGQKGTFYFEFSRPLRTMDRLQQDAQFTIGKTSKVSIAFWYPTDGKPWHGSGHYSISCDWVALDILAGSSGSSKTHKNPWDAATAFSLLFSVVAFCLSVFVGHRVSTQKGVPFTPMNNL